jgi:predicted RNase H-like nuclease (RuvC/YqgF family)
LKAELLKQQHLVQELKAATERQAAVIALQEGQIKALTTAALKQPGQEATIAQQQNEIDALKAGLKEQASQIQKVSAQFELSKPEPRTVANNR